MELAARRWPVSLASTSRCPPSGRGVGMKGRCLPQLPPAAAPSGSTRVCAVHSVLGGTNTSMRVDMQENRGRRAGRDVLPSSAPASHPPSKSQAGLSCAGPTSLQSGGALMSCSHTVALPHRPLAEVGKEGAPGVPATHGPSSLTLPGASSGGESAWSGGKVRVISPPPLPRPMHLPSGHRPRDRLSPLEVS